MSIINDDLIEFELNMKVVKAVEAVIALFNDPSESTDKNDDLREQQVEVLRELYRAIEESKREIDPDE